MGGLIIILSITVSTVLWADVTNMSVIACSLVLTGFGAIGAIDDFKKLYMNDSKGISASKKFLYQSIVAVISYYLCFSDSTIIYLPIFKNAQINIGSFFVFWTILVMVGSANAVNLTDGLDGLAMGPIIISSICLAIISYLVGNVVFANYLHMKYISGMSEVCVFLAALVGASMGFMWFNAPPAKIFMGDTGAIAIGGVLGFIAVISKHEIIFAILGGIFVVETVSVILQVLYYKMTGRRFFLMAPIQHHFEKRGWSESTIVFRFWILSIVFGILGLALLKIR
jgi:phospho-N-acetylmuramoyl-pentapeptide-transferase